MPAGQRRRGPSLDQRHHIFRWRLRPQSCLQHLELRRRQLAQLFDKRLGILGFLGAPLNRIGRDLNGNVDVDISIDDVDISD